MRCFMKTIKQILESKGHQVYITTPDSFVIDAVKEMAKMKCGALVVLQEGDIKGVITEQDFTRRVLLKDMDTATTKVNEVMSPEVSVIEPQHSVAEGMAIMTEKRVRHLPVVNANKKLIGIISIGDLVKKVIAEQEAIIGQLEEYIHS